MLTGVAEAIAWSHVASVTIIVARDHTYSSLTGQVCGPAWGRW